MKLSAPGSSSDLETARQIAHRLHQVARPGERPGRGSPAAASLARATVPPPRPQPALPRPPQPERAPALELPPPAPAPSRPSAPAPEFAQEPAPDEPAPPSWDERSPESTGPVDVDALSALADDVAEPAASPVDEEAAIEIEETDATLADIVGETGYPAIENEEGEPGPLTAEPALASEPSPFDDAPLGEAVSEELFDVPPAMSSWEEVVENCMTITDSRGAMLVDPQGQVLATRGYWPEPGAEAIATRLVAMMQKTLKDAPTRSVSAPVGTLQLTAWRVPLADGLVTTAFLSEAPLRAELRTPVDAEILRGAP